MDTLKTGTLVLTADQANSLVGLLDLAVRAHGLNIAAQAVGFQQLINLAFAQSAKQKDSIENKEATCGEEKRTA